MEESPALKSWGGLPGQLVVAKEPYESSSLSAQLAFDEMPPESGAAATADRQVGITVSGSMPYSNHVPLSSRKK